MGSRVPAADCDHRASRAHREPAALRSSPSSQMGCDLLLGRRTPTNRRSRRSAIRQIRPCRRTASPPPHANDQGRPRRKPGETIVDAPKVNLPHSDSAVANLLAFKPIPGAGQPKACSRGSAPRSRSCRMSLQLRPRPIVRPPANRNQTSLAASVVAPAPDIVMTRRADDRRSHQPTPIAPAPNITADKMRASNRDCVDRGRARSQQTPRDWPAHARSSPRRPM